MNQVTYGWGYLHRRRVVPWIQSEGKQKNQFFVSMLWDSYFFKVLQVSSESDKREWNIVVIVFVLHLTPFVSLKKLFYIFQLFFYSLEFIFLFFDRILLLSIIFECILEFWELFFVINIVIILSDNNISTLFFKNSHSNQDIQSIVDSSFDIGLLASAF